MSALAAGPDLGIKSLPTGTVFQIMSDNLSEILSSGTVQIDRTLALKAVPAGNKVRIWIAMPASNGKTSDLKSLPGESTTNDILLSSPNGQVSLRTFLQVTFGVVLLLK